MSHRVLYAAILGLVQGITEFLPVSSSGHLLIAEKLLSLAGLEPVEGSLEAMVVMLHLGTLFAVVAVFFKDWVQMLRHPIKNPMLRLLFIASLPALGTKLLFGALTDSLFSGSFLGVSFLITSLFLCLLQILGRKGKHSGQSHEVTGSKAALMGIFQAMALPPGVSRSGATMLGGIACGLDRLTAFRFSFMMSAPAILGGLLWEAKKAVDTEGMRSLFSADVLPGVALAAISGFIALKTMMRLVEKLSFYRFALYVAAVAVAVFVLQFTKAVSF